MVALSPAMHSQLLTCFFLLQIGGVPDSASAVCWNTSSAVLVEAQSRPHVGWPFPYLVLTLLQDLPWWRGFVESRAGQSDQLLLAAETTGTPWLSGGIFQARGSSLQTSGSQRRPQAHSGFAVADFN